MVVTYPWAFPFEVADRLTDSNVGQSILDVHEHWAWFETCQHWAPSDYHGNRHALFELVAF